MAAPVAAVALDGEGSALAGVADAVDPEVPVVADEVDPEVPVVPCGAVAAESVDAVEPVAAAAGAVAEALAGDDGSSLLGAVVAPAELLPLIDAANAVMCVRTSCSFARAGSSRVTDEAALPRVVVFGAVAVDPDVPVGSVAPVVLAEPSSSVRMRSAAATSVLQLAALRRAVPVALACPDDCSRVLM